jgi:hypothetical protein
MKTKHVCWSPARWAVNLWEFPGRGGGVINGFVISLVALGSLTPDL